MKGRSLLAGVAAAGVLAGCGADGPVAVGSEAPSLSGRVVLDGAPDVAVLSESAAEQFGQVQPDVRLRVDRSGEDVAIRRLCDDQVDAVHLARRPTAAEREACASAGTRLIDVRVASDGLAVVAHPEATWARCLSIAQVRRLASSAAPPTWRAVGRGFPDRSLRVSGLELARSRQAIAGPVAAARGKRYPPDDGAIIAAVRRDRFRLGFVGVGYVERQPAEVRTVAIGERGRCVEPSSERIRAQEYRALARPVVLVTREDSLDRTDVRALFRFVVDESDAVTSAALLVGLTDEQARKAEQQVG